jgi:hypothetical protein
MLCQYFASRCFSASLSRRDVDACVQIGALVQGRYCWRILRSEATPGSIMAMAEAHTSVAARLTWINDPVQFQGRF